MEEKYEKRLSELKKAVNDSKLNKLLEQVVSLEAELDMLGDVEKFRINPKNKSQVKINPAFYAYHKTLSAYKECIKLLMKQSEELEEESPLRSYLNSIKSKDREYE